eukprot:TRINITY_DN31695_c0_g1_i2.p4 TRINITY_DN31695_c0_g1~~TRINITY_DN31695_c0_g1_i2.p4  ORF type:complete len:149 (+),score=32.43 TRINITY_DN31695_c0_g1_i2:536-982(+)
MGSLVGDYRKVLVKPINFEYRFAEYSDVNEDVLQNEIEKINKELKFERPNKRQKIWQEGEGNQEQAMDVEGDDKDDNADGQEKQVPKEEEDTTNILDSQEQNKEKISGKAVVLKFQLPPSSYATMLIREITKMDTATMFHKSLSSQTK